MSKEETIKITKSLGEAYDSLTEEQMKLLERDLLLNRRAHIALKEYNDYLSSDEYKETYETLTDDQKFLFYYLIKRMTEEYTNGSTESMQAPVSEAQ